MSTHYYRHDPDTDRCRETGIGSRVCGLPENNHHHTVRAVDPAITAAEARRLGERQENT